MSAAKFTPGPWSVEDPMDFELAIVEADKPTYDWRFIATCSLPDGDDDQSFTSREVHANAHLIAAAPDLYEALERELNRARLSYDRTPGAQAHFERNHKSSLAALAKARGEQVAK